MSTIKDTFFRIENKFDTNAARLMMHHQLLGLFLLFIVAPLLTLLAVGVCACIITMPYILLSHFNTIFMRFVQRLHLLLGKSGYYYK